MFSREEAQKAQEQGWFHDRDQREFKRHEPTRRSPGLLVPRKRRIPNPLGYHVPTEMETDAERKP